MPSEAPAGVAIHATAVAIEGQALLIAGRSGSGKSRLAAALVAASTSRCRILLVGDDRVLLTRAGEAVHARPHPRIAGFLERRGLGLVAVPWRRSACVGGLAVLDDAPGTLPGLLVGLPVLRLAPVQEAARAEAVLAWWPYGGMEARQGGSVSRPDAIRS